MYTPHPPPPPPLEPQKSSAEGLKIEVPSPLGVNYLRPEDSERPPEDSQRTPRGLRATAISFLSYPCSIIVFKTNPQTLVLTYTKYRTILLYYKIIERFYKTSENIRAEYFSFNFELFFTQEFLYYRSP